MKSASKGFLTVLIIVFTLNIKKKIIHQPVLLSSLLLNPNTKEKKINVI